MFTVAKWEGSSVHMYDEGIEVTKWMVTSRVVGIYNKEGGKRGRKLFKFIKQQIDSAWIVIKLMDSQT